MPETIHRYGYIDALRGYAILAVMAVHSSQVGSGLPATLQALANNGKYGVQLFFVVSSLTLIMSWHARSDGAQAFFIRRLFRIAPMFWLATIFYVALYGFAARYSAPNGTSWASVLATVFFLHGWHPETINSIVPGGWSIAVEITFYAVFPLLIVAISSLRIAGIAFLLSAAVAWTTKSIGTAEMLNLMPWLPEYLIDDFFYYWFWNQLPVFIAGFVVFFSLRKTAPPKWALEIGIILAIAVAAILPFSPILLPEHLEYAGCFALLAYCLAHGAGRWLVGQPIRLLGKVSFSAYLWHFCVLDLLKSGDLVSRVQSHSHVLAFGMVFSVVVIVTWALSAISYRIVELPMIAAANRIVKNLMLAQPKVTAPRIS